MMILKSRLLLVSGLLTLSSRIKSSQGVKEINKREQEAPVFTYRGYQRDEDNIDNHRYIVKYKTNNDFVRASFDAQVDGSHIMELPRENSEVMTLRTLGDVQRMEERDDVEYVVRDHKVYMQQSNDNRPYGIRMVKTFSVSDEYMSNQKVCIIDSGYLRSHPDLPSGQHRISGTSRGAGSWFKDGNGHGTHVAGVIAALKNDQGVVGINQGGMVNLHIVRVFRDDGNWAWSSSLIAAAEACIDNGANIINMSLGSSTYSGFEEETFQAMFDNGVLLVAAAGNDGSSNYMYPASYSSVISVAAVNSNKQQASFSQRNNQVDLAAPGVGIKSTFPPDTYRSMSGTSMAAPHVSGVAALVWSHFPEKEAYEIRNALEISAEDRGAPGEDIRYGHGIVNAEAAYEFLLYGCVSTCQDSPIGWHDSDGEQYNCDWYGNDNNCGRYGDDYENQGKTANQACCACGGGTITACNVDQPTSSPTRTQTQSPTSSPTGTPTKLPTSSPTGKPTKSPTQSPTESPTATESPSKSSSTKSPSKSSSTRSPAITGPTMATPTQAPITMSGSNLSSTSPIPRPRTRSPIRPPTSLPSDLPTTNPPGNPTPNSNPNRNPDECRDDPEGWYDADGSMYNCEWYGVPGEDRCRLFGNLYENFGKTANEACCECGAGSNPCEDVVGWHDADGEQYNCEWYSLYRRCEKYGDLFWNFGYTANEACCACKALIR